MALNINNLAEVDGFLQNVEVLSTNFSGETLSCGSRESEGFQAR